MAFTAFSLGASAVYVINDLVDIQADRAHPTKRRRPLAAGTVPIVPAMALAPVLLLAGGLTALAVSLPFAGVLLCYFALTTAYSFYLKRRMLVDVVGLALLYTVRVIGGAVAVGVVASEWLLAFAVLVFTALALIKRYIELAARLDRGMADPTNRNYRISDLPVIAAMAAAAGLNAVTVWSLYISSEAVAGLYSRPLLLWLVSPALLYWVMRMLLLAHRRAIDDDPVVFALHDRNSFIVLCFIGCVVLAAI
jgi:4-hydroxybenzoate polyprenyltransferase